MISLRAGDTRPLDVVLKRGAEAIDLTGASVEFTMKRQNGGEAVGGTCDLIEDPLLGQVRYEWGANETDDPGLYYAEWEITHATTETETVPESEYETIRILPELA